MYFRGGGVLQSWRCISVVDVYFGDLGVFKRWRFISVMEVYFGDGSVCSEVEQSEVSVTC